MREPHSIWVLLGNRSGDNNQALALAESLGQPFEIRHLQYNPLAAVSVFLPPTRVTLRKKARSSIVGPWPDLVIAVGRRSEPVARLIKQRSGGRTKLVRIGNPRVDADVFDLIVTTRQYPPPKGRNVVLLPFTLSRYTGSTIANDREKEWLGQIERPIRLVAIGGPTKYWRLCEDAVLEAIAPNDGGSCIISTSRRTGARVTNQLRRMAKHKPNVVLVTPGFPRFDVLLDVADEVYVTGDSVSMISEAVAAGKKTAIIPIVQDRLGKAKLGHTPSDEGRDAHRRDLRRFWAYLIDNGLVGTPETGARRAKHIPDVNRIAADAVRELLGDGG